MPTRKDRLSFGSIFLAPLVLEAGGNVNYCYMDDKDFVHIEYGDGTERMVCVAGCTFKEMTEQVLKHI